MHTFPLPQAPLMSVLNPVPNPIRFEGGKKKKSKPMDADSLKLEQTMLSQDVSGKSLWQTYKVRLWNIRQLKGKVLLKIDASANKKVSLQTLVRHLQDALKQPVIVKLKDVDDCCHKQCKGCLADRSDKQKTWNL